MAKPRFIPAKVSIEAAIERAERFSRYVAAGQPMPLSVIDANAANHAMQQAQSSANVGISFPGQPSMLRLMLGGFW